MKKIFNLLFALPLVFAFVACSNDDDIPQISVNVEASGCWKVENDANLYVVEGDTMYVDGLYVKSLEGKDAFISQAEYYLNGFFYAKPFAAPYMIRIPSENLITGKNSLIATMTVGVVDYPVSIAEAGWDIVKVASTDDLPSGAVYTAPTYKPGAGDEDQGDTGEQ